MTYRKYFDSHDPNGPQQFYDSIAGQAASRTMGRDEKGAFVEYQATHQPVAAKAPLCARFARAITETFSGDSGFIDIGRLPVLPLAIALVAGYAIHFMAIHGIFQALSALGVR